MPFKMPCIAWVFCLLIGLLFDNALQAQDILQKDTIDLDARYHSIIFARGFNLDSLQLLDTTLVKFHRKNPLQNPAYEYLDLGSIAQAHFPMVFEDRREIGLDVGFDAYHRFIWTPEEVIHFKVGAPLTDVFYQIGNPSLQLIDFTHAQNFKKKLNSSIQYRRVSSKGNYERQRAGTHALNFSNWYQSSNGRYNFLANFIWNQNRSENNGGVVLDSTVFGDGGLFQSGISRIARLSETDPKFADAESKSVDKYYVVHQTYDLGKTDSVAINDSVKKATFKPSFQLGHTFTVNRKKYRFLESNPTTSNISLINNYWRLTSVANSVQIKWLNRGDFLQGTKAKIALHHNYAVFKTKSGYFSSQTVQKNLHYLHLTANLKNRQSAILHYDLTASYGLAGYILGDLSLDGTVAYNGLKNIGHFTAAASVKRLQPNYLQEYHVDNYALWQANNFKKTNRLHWKLQYQNPNKTLQLSYETYVLDNYLFYRANSNDLVRPQQLESALFIQQIKVGVQYQIKQLHFSHQMVYQNVNEDWLHLPNFYTLNSIYWQGHIFKNELLLQLGLNLTYFSNYYGDDFIPVLNQFYWQDEIQISAPPLLDVFINFQIKQARFYIKGTYLNQGLFSQGYYVAPNHPAADRAFHFGVRWLFYD